MSVESDITDLQNRVADLEEWRNNPSYGVDVLLGILAGDVQELNSFMKTAKLQIQDIFRRLEAIERSKNRVGTAFELLIKTLGSKGSLNGREILDILGELHPEDKEDLPPSTDIISGRTLYASVKGAPEQYPYDTVGPGSDPTAPRTARSVPAPAPASIDESAVIASVNARTAESQLPDLKNVVWLGTDVSSWNEVSPLSITMGTRQITFSHSASWTPVRGQIGNVWVFVKRGNLWYGGSWAPLRVGQTELSRSALNGSSIGIDPLRAWRPISGVRYYFMLSGIATGDIRNQQERTSVASVVWP